MRLIFSFWLLLLSLCALGNPLLPKLNSINKCWSEQADAILVNDILPASETEWIKLHLASVEQTLRSRNMAALSNTQQQNRLNALDHLHEYWLAGRFPQNEEFAHRLPIFIDKYDNFCAVGYLVKATGFEHVSRKISANTNYAYVREMNYPELTDWANEFGFTVDELAWIQPSYTFPGSYLVPMGKGTDGIVHELFVDSTNQRLYIGGAFTNVDSVTMANNIAYVTESNGIYTWQNLGAGVNGVVLAVAKHNNNIFVGGTFTMAGSMSVSNIAYWNGSTWNTAGCLNGSVKELIVYKGDLYASGQFSICPSSTNVNFAKWTGSSWQGIPGLSGIINTMEVKDTTLLLGGSFAHMGNTANAIKWNSSTGFQPFNNTIKNEVNDFAVYKDTVYAVCKHTAGIDATLFKKLYGNSWDSVGPVTSTFTNYLTYNTACAISDTFLVAGDFNNQWAMMGPHYYNCIGVSPGMWNTRFNTNGPVNKMVVFKGAIYAGGDFSIIGVNSGNKGIGRREPYYPPVPPPYATAGGKHVCKAKDGSAVVTVTMGWPPYSYFWSTGDTSNAIYNLNPGIYQVFVTDSKGKKDTASFEVKMAIDKTLAHYGNILAVKTFGGKYQWINCSGNQVLTGDTLPTYAVKQTGEYAAIITANGCTDTTECSYVKVTGVKEIVNSNIRIYPNPVYAELKVEFDKLQPSSSITITNVAGQELLTRNYAGLDKLVVNVETLPKGMYIVMVKQANGKTTVSRFVKD